MLRFLESSVVNLLNRFYGLLISAESVCNRIFVLNENVDFLDNRFELHSYLVELVFNLLINVRLEGSFKAFNLLQKFF